MINIFDRNNKSRCLNFKS